MGRAVAQTTRCTGCHRILVENLWMPERREYHVKYRTGLCPQCVSLEGARPLPGQPEARPVWSVALSGKLDSGV